MKKVRAIPRTDGICRKKKISSNPFHTPSNFSKIPIYVLNFLSGIFGLSVVLWVFCEHESQAVRFQDHICIVFVSNDLYLQRSTNVSQRRARMVGRARRKVICCGLRLRWTMRVPTSAFVNLGSLERTARSVRDHIEMVVKIA